MTDEAFSMIGRRSFVLGGAGVVGGAALWGGANFVTSSKTYSEAMRSTWSPLLVEGGARELARYATLAANNHNTQPWTFKVEDNRIVIAPDFGRQLAVVDPNNHHLFVSLGCAAENLVHAAAAAGLKATPSFESDRVAIPLESTKPTKSPLFEAIPHRQSTRAAYDGNPVANETLRILEQAGSSDGVSIFMITEPAKMGAVIDYVLAGNSAQMRDGAYLKELETWLRFNKAEAVATRDGLFAGAAGNPSLPGWFARLILPFVFTESGENDKYRAHIRSSAGVAVFVGDRNDKFHWVEVGRACQRFALQATSLGLKYAFINQPVEQPRVREQFAAYLGIGDRLPDLVIRFGVGPETPRSLRRPLDQVTA